MFSRKQEGIGVKAELEGEMALGRGHSSSIITGDKEEQMGPRLGRWLTIVAFSTEWGHGFSLIYFHRDKFSAIQGAAEPCLKTLPKSVPLPRCQHS